MAKAVKGKRAVSIHSRAARRATSPSIDLDKSLKTVAPPQDSNPYLGVQGDAGVRKRKGKQKSRKQRLRQEKGMDRAEAVLDQLEKKVAESHKRLRSVKDRRHDWEDINEKAGDRKRVRVSRSDVQENADDSQMKDVEGAAVVAQRTTFESDAGAAAATSPASVASVDEDVIL